MGKKISSLLPLIGIILFIYIIWKTGISNVLNVFSNINPFYLILMLFMLFVIFFLKGLKWKIILDSLGIDYSLWKASKIWYIGFFIATITPAKIGDFVRAFYVKKDTKNNLGTGFLTVFLDRIFDTATILLLALTSIIIFSLIFETNLSIGLIILIIVSLFVLIYLSTRKKFVKITLKPFFNLLVPEKYKKITKLNFYSFYNNLKIIKTKKGMLFSVLITTLITWFICFLYAYVVALAFNIEINIAYIFLIMPLVTLIELIPISVSGLGTREATLIFFFSLVGIAKEFAVSFSLLYMAGGWLLALIGAIFWFKNPIRFK